MTQFYYNLGRIYGKLNDRENEMKNYQRAIKRDTNSVSPPFSLGCVYYSMGDYQNASLCFLRVLDLDSNMSRAYR